MSSFKPIDGSKEDFRKYLDRKGVLDAITKVLIKCNSDRPENAIEYLLDNLGEKLKDKDTIARLESELNDARNEIEALKREIGSLKLNASATASGESSGVITSTNESSSREERESVSADSSGQQQQPQQDTPTEADSIETNKQQADKAETGKEPANSSSSTSEEAGAKTSETTESEPKEAAAQ